MVPAWERHDFAGYAAQLVRVRRLEWAFRILMSCAVATLALPLLFGLIGAPPYVVASAPLLGTALLGGGFACRGRSLRVQQTAIACWVGAGEPA